MDLGELEVPEPPLFHQAECDSLELFLDSPSNTEREIPSPVSLVGTWNGTYTQTDTPTRPRIITSILITEQNADGAFNGYAIDANDTFTVTGALHGNKIDFIKSPYWGWDCRRRCTGILDTKTETIVGQWDPTDKEVESAPASAIEGETSPNRPAEGTDGGSREGQPLMAQVTPCDIEIAVEDPTSCREKPEEERGNGEKIRDDDKVSQAGTGDTVFRTFSLVRRPPLDDFFYTPFDMESHESRPKALWRMVRNATEHWYRSRNLTWNELRQRRDQRNRYVELYLKQERDGRFWNPDDGIEWARVICRTHPRDLLLWRAVAEYKQRCMIQLAYVYNLNARLPLMADSCTDCLGGSGATIA